MPPAVFSPLSRAHVLLRTLRSPKRLRPCWTSLFEHSLIFPKWVSVNHMLLKRQILEIFNCRIEGTSACLRLFGTHNWIETMRDPITSSFTKEERLWIRRQI